MAVLQVVILSLSSENVSLPFSQQWKVIWRKFQFNYPRRKPHWLCHGKRQKAPTPEPQRDAGWHRRLGNCLPNWDLSPPANHIVACRDGRERFLPNATFSIQLQNANSMLPTLATFIFLEKPGVPLKGRLCFVPLDMWWGASSDFVTKWEVAQLPFGKLWGLRTPEPLPYLLVGRNLPDCFFVPAKVPTQVVWLYLPHL